MGVRTILLTLLALCFELIPSVSRPNQEYAALGEELDFDGDGIVDSLDVCPRNAFGVAVDPEGRPLGDIDRNCTTDLNDFRLMQLGWTGNAEFDVVGVWDAFYLWGDDFRYYGRFTFYASHLLTIVFDFRSGGANVYYTTTENTGTIGPGDYDPGSCSFTATLRFETPDTLLLTFDTLSGSDCLSYAQPLSLYRR